MIAMRQRLHLCDMFGIPVYLDVSLLVLLFLFATGGGSFWSGIVCAFALMASITLHELGHALTARSFGYATRDITLSLLGGCASLIALPRKASQEFLTAVAGPAVSFALAVLGTAGVACVSYDGSFAEAAKLVASETLDAFGVSVDWGGEVYATKGTVQLLWLFLYLAVMNMMLGLFNLLPGFPMDGGRVFRSAMRPFMSRVKATYIAMCVGRVVAVFIGMRGFWNLTHGGSWGFVTMLIAWMIWREGYREYLLARAEASYEYADYRARYSPPPYGGSGGESDVGRDI